MSKGKGPGKFYREDISLIDLCKKFSGDDTAEKWFEQERWTGWHSVPIAVQNATL